jgi:asparagine synthase (glutamine-hydrolysing)
MINRYCAVISDLPGHTIEQAGTEVVFDSEICALGGLNCSNVWQFHDETGGNCRDFWAVGDVVLFNRAEIEAEILNDPASSLSDGDLLLRLFARKGPEGLASARGMFAMAVWDGSQLYLISDPVGSMSVFYCRSNGKFIAANSLRVFKRFEISHELDYRSLGLFLSMAYLPGAHTLISGTKKLLPGCCMRVARDGRCSTVNYWEPREPAATGLNPPELYAERLKAILEDSVKSCLPKDEEVGVFLSGGIDSSLVAILAARLHHRPIHTYTVNFGSENPHELDYAGAVAKECGSKHKIITLSGKDIADNFAGTVGIMDCPVGEGLTVPNLLMSRIAADDGIGIILNGEGGDPNFGGPKNLPMLAFELQNTTGLSRAAAYLGSHKHCYQDLTQILTRDALERVRAEAPIEDAIHGYLHTVQAKGFLNRLMYANLRMKGPGYMLAKMEFIADAGRVQARAPLFDLRVIDEAFSIPQHYKLSGVNEKYALKRAAEGIVPENVINRPKSGMKMPMKTWLTGCLRDLADKLLLDERSRKRNLLRQDTIRVWLDGKGLVFGRHGQKIWLLLTLEAWLRAYLDE